MTKNTIYFIEEENELNLDLDSKEIDFDKLNLLIEENNSKIKILEIRCKIKKNNV